MATIAGRFFKPEQGLDVLSGTPRAQAHRELIELDLVEVSLVANPMQPKARVHAVETNV